MTTVIEYGDGKQCNVALVADQLAFVHAGPLPQRDLDASIDETLFRPLDFPPLSAAVVEGDRVVIALDHHIPQASLVVAAIWKVLAGQQVAASDVTIIQPGNWYRSARGWPDPRQALPADVREAVHWLIHDPTDAESIGYLASSAGGERIYLARTLLDADLVIPVGLAAFDPLLGFRGPTAMMYPGCSNLAAWTKAHGSGHSELSPEDERPLRQLVEEVGWLLGVQFAVQVVPSQRGDAAAQVLAGQIESVAGRSRVLLNDVWRVTRPRRAETVIAAISSEDVDFGGWEALGRGLETARRLVRRGGAIVAISSLTGEHGPGVQLVRDLADPAGSIQPLQQLAPPDLRTALQIAEAAAWAKVYLLSPLSADVVENLSLIPLGSETELQRFLAQRQDCVVLSAADSTFAEIDDAP